MNLKDNLKHSLPAFVYKTLREIGALADRLACNAYVVGGFVRDLMLGVPNFDMDIVVECDPRRAPAPDPRLFGAGARRGSGAGAPAIDFARQFASRSKGSLVVHTRFGTATVVILEPRRMKIDFATARTETYEHPAALPTVEFGSISGDLFRRDFSINAMAIALNPRKFGRLIDPVGGRVDLARGVVRALYENSFIDDPTRIFRAVRFEARYNFSIERHTKGLIKRAIRHNMFDRTHAYRIREELILILSELRPLRALSRMRELHELQFIHPKVKYSRQIRRLFRGVEKTLAWYEESFPKKRRLDKWLVYFLALSHNLNADDRKALCGRFAFRRSDRMRIIKEFDSRRGVLRLFNKKRLKPSEAYKTLKPLPYEVLAFQAALTETGAAKKLLGEYFTKWEHVHIATTGDDLRALGFSPGPEFKEILNQTLYAKLDGKISDRQDEIAYVRSRWCVVKGGGHSVHSRQSIVHS